MSYHLYRRRPSPPRRGLSEETKFHIIIALIVIGVAAFVAFAAYAAVQAQSACEARGGVYESDGECEVNGEDLVEYDD